MKNRIPSTKKRQRGNALVEASLIFTAFFCMLIGAFDFGQFLFIHQALVERARYASRWGATAVGAGTYDPTTASGASDLQTAVQNQVRFYQASTPSDTSNPYFGLATSMVQVSTSGIGTDNARINLLITNYPYVMISPYIAGPHTGPNILVTAPLGQ